MGTLFLPMKNAQICKQISIIYKKSHERGEVTRAEVGGELPVMVRARQGRESNRICLSWPQPSKGKGG